MKYELRDYYESKFGEYLYSSKRLTDITKFAKQYSEETDGECYLIAFLYDDYNMQYVSDSNNKAVRFNPYNGNIGENTNQN